MIISEIPTEVQSPTIERLAAWLTQQPFTSRLWRDLQRADRGFELITSLFHDAARHPDPKKRLRLHWRAVEMLHGRELAAEAIADRLARANSDPLAAGQCLAIAGVLDLDAFTPTASGREFRDCHQAREQGSEVAA